MYERLWDGPDGLGALVSHDKQALEVLVHAVGDVFEPAYAIVASADAVVWGAGGAPAVAVRRIDADDVGVLEDDVGAGHVEVEVVVLAVEDEGGGVVGVEGSDGVVGIDGGAGRIAGAVGLVGGVPEQKGGAGVVGVYLGSDGVEILVSATRWVSE